MKKFISLVLVALVVLISIPALATNSIGSVVLNDNVTMLTSGEIIYRHLNGNNYEAIGSYIIGSNFPLAGQRYVAYVGSKLNQAYDAVWTESGRLWQPQLPSRWDRTTHTIAIKLASGYVYVVNGVESIVKLDWDCDGKTDTEVANREDGKTFSVPVDVGVFENDVRVVWGVIWSTSPSGGTEIIAVGQK